MKLSGKTKMDIAGLTLYIISVIAFWDNFKWWIFLFTAFFMGLLFLLVPILSNLFDKWIDE